MKYYEEEDEENNGENENQFALESVLGGVLVALVILSCYLAFNIFC